MEVVEVLAMYEEVQHVVSLTADLQSHLNPVQLCTLEKLGGLEWPEQVPDNYIMQQDVFQKHNTYTPCSHIDKKKGKNRRFLHFDPIP